MVYRISARINKLQPAWKYNTSIRLYFCVCLCMCVLYTRCMDLWACVWTCACGHAHLSFLLFTLTFALFCFVLRHPLQKLLEFAILTCLAGPGSAYLHSSMLGLQAGAVLSFCTGPGIQTQALWLWASTLPTDPLLQMWRSEEDMSEFVLFDTGKAIPTTPMCLRPWGWQSPPRVRFRRMAKTFLWSKCKCWQCIQKLSTTVSSSSMTTI